MAGLLTVDVEVAGRTLPFVFDTGGGVTVLTLETAALAGCEPFGRSVGFRHDGSPVELQRCAGVALAVGGRRTADEEVAVWDLMKLLRGAPEVGGLVSLKSFEGTTITIDWPARRLRLESEASLREAIRGAAELRIRDARQVGGGALDVFVAIDSARGPLWFELDSGHSGPDIVAPHAAALLGLELAPGETREADLPVRGLGVVRRPVRLKESLVYDGLVGIGFFETHVVTLDLARMRGWARRVER